MVSLPPYRDFVKRIAGDSILVEVLVPPGFDPHVFDPSPKEINMIASTSLWVNVGMPFETRLLNAAKQVNQQMQVLNLQDHVDRILESKTTKILELEGKKKEHHHHGHDSCCHTSGYDPHIWMSPKMMIRQVQAINLALGSILPEKREQFNHNTQELLHDLQSLDEEISNELTPFRGESLLVSHPSLGYFCRDYNLLQISIEMEGKDPLPREVQEIVNQLKQRKINCVFIEPQFNNRGAKLIAEMMDLDVIEFNPLSEKYFHMIRYITHAITSCKKSHELSR